MKVAILGNGPSLVLDKALFAPFEKILITNRLIWENFSSWDKHIAYVCSDERFSTSAEWVAAIQNTTYEVFLSENLASIFSEGSSNKPIHSYRNLQGKQITNEFLDLFPLVQDMNANVVLDLGIPVALFFGASEICLFGCEFDYKLNRPSDKPNYYDNYQKRGIAFDHSVSSSKKWSHHNQLKFLDIENFLSTHGVRLSKNP